MSRPLTKDDAQRRADRIQAFRAELTDLRSEGVEPPPTAWYDAVAGHQDTLLASLAGAFDIDRTIGEKRMSLGMRLASAFGAAALTATVVSFFYRIWGALPTAAQVAVLTAAPLAALAAMVIAARRERTLYVASLCAIVACGAFVLQVVTLGQIFNMRGSPHAMGAWGTFALAAALRYRFALPFAWGVVSIVCYVAALTIALAGAPWTHFGERPETLMLPAVAVCAAAATVPRQLRAWARGAGLVVLCGSVLALSTFGPWSLLPWSREVVEGVYQVLAVALGATAIVAGIRRAQAEVLVIGATFSGVFLIVRFVDWWWDWMPKYLFFLILSVLAIAWLWLLRILRRRLAVAR